MYQEAFEGNGGFHNDSHQKTSLMNVLVSNNYQNKLGHMNQNHVHQQPHQHHFKVGTTTRTHKY